MKRLRLETLQSEVPAANLFDIGVSSPDDIARSIVEETIRIGKSTKAQPSPSHITLPHSTGLGAE
jgi:hypothetical protein